MRRAIRIKSFTMLLAWFVIFAHGVVPHNHLDDPSSVCHHLLHSTGAEDNQSGDLVRTDGEQQGKRACHYSGFVFHQLSDNIILNSDKPGFIKPPEIYTSNNFHSTELFISDPYWCNSALRAPPVL